MYPIKNYDELKSEANFTALQPGGYILKITDAADDESKEYFKLIWDIAEGPEKDRYADEWGKDHPWAHNLIRSYKESAQQMFKGFITSLEQSNNVKLAEKVKKGTLSPKDLIGLQFGAVLGYVEYEDKNAEERGEDPIKIKIDVRFVRSVDAIRQGKFTIPDVKKLKRKDEEGDAFKPVNNESFTPIKDEDLPF